LLSFLSAIFCSLFLRIISTFYLASYFITLEALIYALRFSDSPLKIEIFLLILYFLPLLILSDFICTNTPTSLISSIVSFYFTLVSALRLPNSTTGSFYDF